MALQPKSFAKAADEPEQFSYRCPGCGEMVDERRMSDVLEHHRHVIQPAYPPAWFQQAISGPYQSSRSRSDTAPQARPFQARDSSGTSAESTSRRYGHN